MPIDPRMVKWDEAPTKRPDHRPAHGQVGRRATRQAARLPGVCGRCGRRRFARRRVNRCYLLAPIDVASDALAGKG